MYILRTISLDVFAKRTFVEHLVTSPMLGAGEHFALFLGLHDLGFLIRKGRVDLDALWQPLDILSSKRSSGKLPQLEVDDTSQFDLEVAV